MSKDTKSRIHLAPTSYVSSWIPARNRRNSEFICFGGQDGQLSIPVQVKYLDSVDTCKNCHVETLKGSQRRLQQLRESGETWDAVQEMMISRTVHAMCLHIAIVYIYYLFIYCNISKPASLNANQCILCTSFIMILLARKWHIECIYMYIRHTVLLLCIRFSSRSYRCPAGWTAFASASIPAWWHS